ncbi:MAG: hypothetical protein ACJAWW_001866 [Sulfurimonas sp.]|jgi:hypothetical protein
MDFSNASIEKLIVHQVGNKQKDEGVFLSHNPQSVEPELENKLLHYFLKPFQLETDLHRFTHSSNLSFNEVYMYAKSIFENNDFAQSAERIASHLYNASTHPKIMMGELLIVHFKDIKFDEEFRDAIGIYKVEKKDMFFKVLKNNDSLTLGTDEGINASKIEKGCFIINDDAEQGYNIYNIDIHQKVTDYWVNKFLSIAPVENDSFKTKQFMNMCKGFVDDVVTPNYEKSEQVDFGNNCIDFFEKNENFSQREFFDEMASNENMQEDFRTYRDNYADESSVSFDDDFGISKDDVKKYRNSFRASITLDESVQIKFLNNTVQEGRNYEKGYDEETGQFYYKFFFEDEY